MRLINVHSYELEHFLDSRRIPPYAILSHTWGDEEVSFQDMKWPSQASSRRGFKKIQHCCQQARKDGLSWAWIDTCCIDKTSSAELSEAINSMFAWYAESSTCYVHLEDMKSVEDLLNSSATPRGSYGWQPPRWFTRGWTLQELIAPLHIEFYSVEWQPLGSRSEHQKIIRELTGIEHGVLDGSLSLDEVPVATRMSWASQRMTTRKEDEAYCLLGIFNINLPLLYGEGEKAFQRLLNEILGTIEDQTIFLWGRNRPVTTSVAPLVGFKRVFLPSSPRDYEEFSSFRPFLSDFDPDIRVTTRERGIRISARAMKLHDCKSLESIAQSLRNADQINLRVMALNCEVDSTQGDSSDPVQGVVALLVQPSEIAGSGMTTLKRYGNWYIVLPRHEVEKWPICTCYLQVAGIGGEDFDGAGVIWKTPDFGYGDYYIFEPVNTVAEHDSPGCIEVGFAWGTILDQCSSLPWILVTIGHKWEDASTAFCDVWCVPDLLRSRLLALEQKNRLNPKHRAHILCDARIEMLYAASSGVTWKKRHREHGLWAKAGCWVEGDFELTAALLANSEVQLSMRPTSRLTRGSDVQGNAHEIWRYIESSVLQVLYSEHEEYSSFYFSFSD